MKFNRTSAFLAAAAVAELFKAGFPLDGNVDSMS